MPLQDDVLGEPHVGVRLVDELQGVAVAGDLLFRTVPRLRLMDDPAPGESWATCQSQIQDRSR